MTVLVQLCSLAWKAPPLTQQVTSLVHHIRLSNSMLLFALALYSNDAADYLLDTVRTYTVQTTDIARQVSHLNS